MLNARRNAVGRKILRAVLDLGQVGGKEDIGRDHARQRAQRMLDQPCAGRAPHPADLQQHLLRGSLRIDSDGWCVGFSVVGLRIGDQAHLQAAAEDFRFTNVLAAGENAALQQDGVDIGASHAAEGEFPAAVDAQQRLPPAGKLAESAGEACRHGQRDPWDADLKRLALQIEHDRVGALGGYKRADENSEKDDKDDREQVRDRGRALFRGGIDGDGISCIHTNSFSKPKAFQCPWRKAWAR